MPHSPASPSSFYEQLEVSPGDAAVADDSPAALASLESIAAMLREIRDGQGRQNELLQELVQLLSTAQRQRAHELHQWKKAHPHLSAECRRAADALGRVQAEYLRRVTIEAREGAEAMAEGEFLMNEFIDRFAPRLAQLHSLLQVLSHLGGNGATQTSEAS
jgi:hypothetical protein